MSAIKRNGKDVTDAIGQVLSGDVESYELVYKMCDGRLRSFIGSRFRHLGSDFVEEVAVRTHERALEKLAEFDPARACFQTWLNWQSRRVASQVMAEWRGPRFTGFDEKLHARYVPTLASPEELHERLTRDELVRQEFAALDAQGRLTMMYHDLQGWTFKATAAAMGMTVGSVRRRRDKAIRHLRRRLAKHGGFIFPGKSGRPSRIT
jgi:RNA polymerase sigma factor (sigma-70 family)